MSQAGFFAFGNSNAMSSIDLSNAYNGVSSFNVVAVGVLVFVGNWAAPIWWTSTTVLYLFEESRGVRGSFPGSVPGGLQSEVQASDSIDEAKAGRVVERNLQNSHLAFLAGQTVFVSFSLLAMMVACTVLRTHLFIWTVFSPKFLYAMAWAVGHHLVVSTVCTGLLVGCRGLLLQRGR